MEIRVRSTKSIKDKDVESWIYNKKIRVCIPENLKDKDVESWILGVDQGAKS